VLGGGWGKEPIKNCTTRRRGQKDLEKRSCWSVISSEAEERAGPKKNNLRKHEVKDFIRGSIFRLNTSSLKTWSLMA